MDKNIEKLLSQILENTAKTNATLEVHTNKLIELENHINNLEIENNKRFQSIENRIEKLEAKYDQKFQDIEDCIDKLEAKYDQKFQDIEDCIDKLEAKYDQKFQDIQACIDKLKTENNKRFQSIEERLTSIENIVTKIELEHGEKIQILFDYFVSNSDNFKEIRQEISKINLKLDDLDNRIYALDFYKRELLSAQ